MPRFFKLEESQNKSSDDPMFMSPEYAKIMEAIQSLTQNGVAKNFAGNCIAACDILQSLLNSVGIKSKIVEVQLSMIRNVDGATDYVFVGYDSVSFEGQVDTHVVLITETKVPILIDLSLAYYLPADKPYIIKTLGAPKNNQTVLEHTIENIQLTYKYKSNLKLPQLHQKSLVERILQQSQMEENIKFLKNLVMIAVGISVINFSLNMILIVLKAIYP